MCNSRAEGGQRCYSHTANTLVAAEYKHATLTYDADTFTASGQHVPNRLRVDALQAEFDLTNALARYASTPQGATDLTRRMDQLAINGQPPENQPDADRYHAYGQALSEGTRLRTRAKETHDAVKAGRMTTEEAAALSRYPSEQIMKDRQHQLDYIAPFCAVTPQAQRAAQTRLFGTRRSAGTPEVTDYVHALHAVANADHAYQALVQEARKGITTGQGAPEGFITRGFHARHNLDDALVLLAVTPHGEQDLVNRMDRLVRAGQAPRTLTNSAGHQYEYHTYAYALSEGRRLRETTRNANADVAAGILTPAQAAELTRYPDDIDDSMRAQEIADQPRTHRSWLIADHYTFATTGSSRPSRDRNFTIEH